MGAASAKALGGEGLSRPPGQCAPPAGGAPVWGFPGVPEKVGRALTFLRLGPRPVQLLHAALGPGSLPLLVPQPAAQAGHLGAPGVLEEDKVSRLPG